MPACLGTSQSVRASSMPRSAWWALVFQTFWPLTTQLSPSSTAVVMSPATSDPAAGSLNSWHQVSSPVSSGRRNRSRTGAGPCSKIVGPAGPAGMLATAWQRLISSATMSSAQAGSPFPYQRTGQDGTAQPELTRRSRQSRKLSEGSQFRVTHSRTSWRTRPGSAVSVVFMRGPSSATGEPGRAPVADGRYACTEILRPPEAVLLLPLARHCLAHGPHDLGPHGLAHGLHRERRRFGDFRRQRRGPCSQLASRDKMITQADPVRLGPVDTPAGIEKVKGR